VPPPQSDDPLLPDRERQRAGGFAEGIPLRGGRNAQERYRYLAALAAGEQCILTFPKANSGAQRGQFPSRWFLEAASRLSGSPVYTSNLWSLGSAPWLTVVASPEDGLRSVATEAAADVHDRDIHHLWCWRGSGELVTAHHLAASGHLSRALALERSRAERQLSRWDGDVSAIKGQARRLRLLERSVLSPSSLETWATCPFRYFMGHVLRVAAVEEPEEVWTISPLEKGSLVHGVMDSFIRTVQERGEVPSPGEPWRPEHRDLLSQLAHEAFAEAESRGVTGKALLWEIQQEAIRSDLEAFLEADAALRARFGVTPHRVEVGFGLRTPAAGEPALPPAERYIPGVGTLRFRGAVDRVDLDASGRVAVVLDYKTGGASSYEALKKDPVDAGRRLQLPIYTLALQGILGEGVMVYAAYWFVSARGKFILLPPEPVELSQVAGAFNAAVGTIAQGIAAGLFPANPGPEDRGGFANCGWCDFESLCPSRRDVLWQRKQVDPRLQPYMRLQASQPLPEEVEE
jgi:ATP-dependent helicase/nuclease subunit B